MSAMCPMVTNPAKPAAESNVPTRRRRVLYLAGAARPASFTVNLNPDEPDRIVVMWLDLHAKDRGG
jgi:hypothetical protein